MENYQKCNEFDQEEDQEREDDNAPLFYLALKTLEELGFIQFDFDSTSGRKNLLSFGVL